MRILVFFRRKFLALAASSGKEGIARRELRTLLRDIERRGPRWYRPWSNRFEPGFAERAAALRLALAPVAKVLGRTIAGDKEEERRALEALVDAALAPEGLSRASFGFEEIEAEAGRRGGELLAAMDAVFNHRLGVFRGKPQARLGEAYRTLSRLSALIEYDFEGLLGPFERKGRFAACDGELVATQVADLHFLVEGLDIGREAVSAYGTLRDLVGAEGGAEAAESELAAVESLLSGELRAERIWDAARAARGDAAMELKAYSVAAAACDAWLAEIVDEYAAKRDRLAESRRAAELEARKRTLFEERDILSVLGYGEEYSESFRRNGLPGLGHAAPLSILKSFFQFFFLPFVRSSVAAVLAEIDLRDEEFHRGLALSFEACTTVAANLQELEGDLASPGPRGLQGLSERLRGGRLDQAGRKAARDSIESIERRAEALVQSSFSGFGKLLEGLETVLRDLRSKNPELVANASYLNRNRARELSSLERSVGLVAEFLRLLGFFAVDQVEARKAAPARAAR